MSDGHLYVGDDGVSFEGDAGTFWVDESHGSVLVLAAETSHVVEIPLGVRLARPLSSAHEATRPVIMRSKSAPALVVGDAAVSGSSDQRNAERLVLFDFATSASTSANPNSAIVLLRLSLDRQFLAIQKSDVEVQIVRITTRETFWIVCKSKPGNRILSDGVLWNSHATAPQSSQDLFLVTKLGIEQYRVSSKRRSCSLHRSIAVYIHTFWYSPSHSVLIVTTGSRANEIVPFLMQGPTVEKLPRLVFSTAVRNRDLYLASLYGELFAVYGDSKSTRLLLYRVARDKVSCVRSLHLMLPAGSPLEFSVVDNLLVCHSVEFSVAFFFDVKCDTDTHDPFSHPLPVSILPPVVAHKQPHGQHSPLVKAGSTLSTRRGDVESENLSRRQSVHASELLPSPRNTSVETTSSSKRLQHQQHVHMNHHVQINMDSDRSVVSPWRFIPPDLVQRSVTRRNSRANLPDLTEIRRFHLNLEHVCRSCAHHVEILPFLLRRNDQQVAKTLALGLVRERLEEQPLAPGPVSALLASVQTISHQDLYRRIGGGRGEGGNTSDESANDTSSEDEARVPYDAQAVGPPVSLRKRFFRHGGTNSVSSSMWRLPPRNSNGHSIIFQHEIMQHVWEPLLSSPKVALNGVLSSYLLEFIRLLHQSHVPVETLTYIALVKAYFRAGKIEELYQVVQYHVLDDSTELADLLLEYGKADASLRQLALDMYTRLGSSTTIIRALLNEGEIDKAIAVSWKYLKTGAIDSSSIPGAVFFSVCVQSLFGHGGAGTFEVQRRLQTLLLFLRVWDGACLVGVPSPLALSATVAFPDQLLPQTSLVRWRKGFGFPMS